MALKLDIKKAIEANTKYKVKKIWNPTYQFNGYDVSQSTNVMTIEVVVSKNKVKHGKVQQSVSDETQTEAF